MNKVVAFLIGFCLWLSSYAKPADTISLLKKSSFIEAYNSFGSVFNTNPFVSPIQSYQALSLRYAFASNGSSWEDIAYNMPFMGVGFYTPFFSNNPGLGNPVSIYMFRGSTLAQFTDNLGLILEMNVGLSMNWKNYDPFDNPNNSAIGSPNNVHVGLRLHLDYVLSKHFDLKFGVDLTHFSNGSSRMPNSGINMGSLSLGLGYNINPVKKGFILRNSSLTPPIIPRHIAHDVQFVFSSRQRKFAADSASHLPSPYIDTDFKVFGLAYSPMIVNGYKYKWGPSLHLTYDESSNAQAWRQWNPADSLWYDRVKVAKLADRLSLGLALRGEVSMPGLSVFATVGYNVFHRHDIDKRLFQTIGIKTYLKDNFFATFGISATKFSVAQFLYWSFGYTISPISRKQYTP
ncbi:MAG: acyloxyacyl hydrolase [Bacteroidales bacterium]|jgi:hypothetical protein|nr:acyloxyacyl hydrolase [Bacteroidales bacterium]